MIGRKLKIKGMNLQVRITATIGLVALAACSFVGVYAYSSAKTALVEATRDRLELVSTSRATTLQNHMEAMSRDLETLAENAIVRIALTDLTTSFRSNAAQREEFTRFFTTPPSREDRLALGGKGSDSLYAWRHEGVHASFRAILTERGYSDILVATKDGEIVYTTAKYQDFGRSMSDGELAGTGLVTAFDLVLASSEQSPQLVDFAPYAIAGGEPSAFLAQAVRLPLESGGSGGVDGVVIYRIATESLDRLISSRDGLGLTGESYVIGTDGRLRSNRPLESQPSALTALGRPEVLAAAAGAFQYTDELGAERFAEKRMLSWLGKDFALITDQTAAEALEQVTATGRGIMMATFSMLLLALALAFLTGRSIVRPIKGLTGALRLLVNDSNLPHVVGEERSDEIGDIARAVVSIRDRVQADAADRQRETEEAQAREAQARKDMMHSLADDLETAVGEAVASLGREASGLSKAANAMASLSDEARGGSDRVANAATTASNSVQDVAASTEQLSMAIVEVSQLIARSSAVTNETNEFAANTSGVVLSLNECANRIGEIVTLIENIANQTNLLALNATIEAARAGEAGKGFAVVAAEVKGLATQTAKATEEIGRQIDEMRAATNTAVSAVGAIQSKVGEISEAMTSVATAVEEQSAATQTIASSADVARGGAASVSDDIASVRGVIVAADEAADVVVKTAAELQKQAASVDERVRSFLAQIKAA